MVKINTIEYADVFEYLNRLDDESIDLAIIDPPYNLDVAEWDSFENLDCFMNFTKKYLELVHRKLKKTGSLYVFNTALNSAYILVYLQSELKMKYQNWIVWYKKDGFSACRKKYVNNQETILFFTKTDNYTFNYNDVREPYESTERINAAMTKGILKNGKRWYPNPNGKLCPDIWEFTSVRLEKKEKGKTKKQAHPTPKPEKMIERMIKASSNEGDLILDLFSGTGTTALIAKRNNRNFVGCDNNIEYIKYIERRLSDEF
ncbi:MAG: site-specific DNA-methyltransferase [Bacilli bacterium]|nr:site-specific DNA-methyltransferase [Bacilli bacterium]